MSGRRGYAIVILLGLWSFHAVNNYIWLSLDQQIPFDDEAFHALGGLQCLELLKRPSWKTMHELMEFSIRGAHPAYPPLVHICMGLFNLVGGPSLLVSKLANLPFFAVLVCSVYGIGTRVGSPPMGLFAAFLVSMYPYVVGLSRTTQTDFALTAMVAFSLCCLLSTEGFTRRWLSLLFGLSLGCGMLTKQMFIVFLLPACLVGIVEIRRTSRQIDGQRLANIAYALMIAAVIAGSWYGARLKELLPYFMVAAYGKGASIGAPSSVLSLSSFLYFGWQLISRQLNVVFALLFLVGVVALCRQGGKWRSYWLWSLVVPYTVFSLFLTKDPKYTVPYLPVAAIVSAGVVWSIRRLRMRRLIVGALVVFGVVQYVAFSYFLSDINEFLRVTAIRLKAPVLFDVLGPGAVFYPQGLRPPARSETLNGPGSELDQLLTLLEHEQPVRGTGRVVVLEKAQRGLLTNYPLLDYYCYRKKLRYEVVPPWRYGQSPFLPDLFILNGEFRTVVPEAIVQRHADQYVLLQQLPDHGVFVYKRQAHAASR